MDILQQQIDGALLLQKSEAVITSHIEAISSEHSDSAEEKIVLKWRLLNLVDLAKKYGKFESIHEILLKDDEGNTEKKG